MSDYNYKLKVIGNNLPYRSWPNYIDSLMYKHKYKNWYQAYDKGIGILKTYNGILVYGSNFLFFESEEDATAFVLSQLT